MRVWLFDLAGGIGSHPFNVHDSPGDFVRVLVGLAVMCRDNLSALGYDLTIHRTPKKDQLY